MKNKEYKTLIAIVLAMAMVAGTLAATPATLYAKENTAKTESTSDNGSFQVSSDTKTMKDETVYAKIDGSGTVTSVTVSDQLKNVKDLSKIEDISTLKDIENVKGDEAFSQKNNSLTWDGDSKDICYQGSTTQTLPVGLKITYKLDGKSISAEELEGKSGHLVMRYQYENTSKTAGNDYTPFLMVTGLILDSDKFTNVTVTNGKLVSDGDRDMALGMGLPEMKSYLGVNDLDIPDYFELEADVTDYEAVEGITIATNDLFNDLETDKLDSLSDLKSSMNKLQDSANQLVDGSGELRKGLDTLLSSSGTLTDGINQLSNGSQTLKNGTGTLADGTNTLAAGSNSLADGTGQLLAGTGVLKEGTNTLDAGLATAAQKTSNLILPGVVQLDDGVTQMQKQLEGGLTELTGAVQQLDAGLNTSLAEGQPSLRDGAAALDQVINYGTQQTGGASLVDISNNTAAAADALGNAITAISTPSVTAASVAEGDGGTDAAINTLSEVLNSCRDDIPEDVKASIQNAIDSLNNDQYSRQAAATALDSEIQAQASQANAVIYDTQTLLTNVLTGTHTIQSIVNTISPSVSALNSGVAQIADGASTLDAKVTDPKTGLAAQVNSGVNTLKGGTSALRAGTDGDNGLANGLNQLSTGASQVNAGAGTLHEKMSEANSGAQSISAGASQLLAGAGELNTGAGTLADGIQTLQTGSGALIDGIKQLDDGAKTLNEGMIQFNEEGIEKLVSAFDGDINELLDNLNTMIDSSRNYKNFSGISDGMDGQVKFIFVTNK